MADPFAVESLLLQRLRDQLSTLRSIQGVRDENTLFTLPTSPPALFLHLEQQKSLLAAGNQQVLEQTWQLWLVVRNLRDPAGEGERSEAAPLLNAILHALLGWQPDADHAPWRLSHGKPPRFAHGHGYYPLSFSTRMSVSAP